MSAYWRNQRRGSTPKPRYACPLCGAPTFSVIPTHLHQHDLRRLDMTSGEIDAFLGKTEPPRDRFGRPMIKTPDGKTKAYTRCTTYVGCLEDTYNLGKWQQRMVALGLAQRDDLLTAVASHTADDKAELDKLCEAAKEAAAASSGATVGTALHKMCERLDRGEKFHQIAAVKADLKAYQEATQGVRWTHIEQITVNDALEVAGTPDRVGVDVDGRARIFDIKTGSIDYGMGKIAMQLAMYAHSDIYDVETGTRSPLDVDLERAVVIHLPAGEGTCALVDVDIAAGWEAVRLARDVREWRKRKGLGSVRTGEQPLPDRLILLIGAAPSRDALLELRAENRERWTEAHTNAAKARVASLATAS